MNKTRSRTGFSPITENIAVEFSVVCCFEFEDCELSVEVPASTFGQAVKEFKKKGWHFVYVEGHGWACNSCYHKYRSNRKSWMTIKRAWKAEWKKKGS